MMVNLLDDSNFHRQTAVMTRLIEMLIQNPVFGKLIGSTYGRFCIKFPQSRMIGERHRLSPLSLQFFLVFCDVFCLSSYFVHNVASVSGSFILDLLLQFSLNVQWPSNLIGHFSYFSLLKYLCHVTIILHIELVKRRGHWNHSQVIATNFWFK